MLEHATAEQHQDDDILRKTAWLKFVHLFFSHLG
jgi:hypothetical protein